MTLHYLEEEKRLCEGDSPETASSSEADRRHLNTIIVCTQNRFDQPGYIVLHTLASLLMKACKKWHVIMRIWTSWSDEYLSGERVLSVTQPGAAIANVASGRTSPTGSF